MRRIHFKGVRDSLVSSIIAIHITMIIQRVASSSDKTRKYIQTFCLRRVPRKWLVISKEEVRGALFLEHGQKVNLDLFSAIWIEDWPALYSCEQFLFDLFSKQDCLIIFSQKYDFSLEKQFFQKWSLSYEFIYKEQLLSCLFSPSLKIIREYSHAYPERMVSSQEFSRNSLQYLEMSEDGGPYAFYAKESSWWQSMGLWLHGRQYPREVLLSFSENKDRGHSYSQDALPRPAYYWRAFTTLWEDCFSSFLWRTGRGEETKKLHSRTWLPHWYRACAK